MKRALVLSICALLCLSLIACGQQTGDTNATKYADKNFLNDVSKAFEKRQDKISLTDEDSIPAGSQEQADHLTELTDIEINALGKYRDQTFEDGKLQEYAIKYLNVLNDAKDAAGRLHTDYSTAADDWQKAYSQRIQLLSTFVNDYGLAFNEKYKTVVDEVLNEAKNIEESTAQDEKIRSILKGLTFSLAENNYGYKKYTAVLKNDSGVNFSYISLTIDLLDSNGVVMEQQYASLSNASNGRSYNVEFTTDKDFTSYDIIPDYAIDK